LDLGIYYVLDSLGAGIALGLFEVSNLIEDKFVYTNNGKCWYCDRDIEEEEDKVVTGCKYCNKSFVD